MDKDLVAKKSLGIIGALVIVHNTSVVSLKDVTTSCYQQEKVKICPSVRRYYYDLSDNLSSKIEAYLNNVDSSSTVTIRLVQ